MPKTIEAAGTRQVEYSTEEAVAFLESLVYRIKEGGVEVLDAVLASDMNTGVIQDFNITFTAETPRAKVARLARKNTA